MKMLHNVKLNCCLYYIAFALYVILAALNNSMMGQNELIMGLMRYVQFLCLALVLFKILLERRHTLRQMLLWLTGLVFALSVLISMGETYPVLIIILLFGADRCCAKTIAKIHLFLGGGSWIIHYPGYIRYHSGQIVL